MTWTADGISDESDWLITYTEKLIKFALYTYQYTMIACVTNHTEIKKAINLQCASMLELFTKG